MSISPNKIKHLESHGRVNDYAGGGVTSTVAVVLVSIVLTICFVSQMQEDAVGLP